MKDMFSFLRRNASGSGFALLLAAALSASAQTITTWTGAGGDTLWSNAANWDQGVPAEGTNAVIGSGVTVDYNTPMIVPSFSTLSSAGVLNVNAGGFVVDAAGDGVIGIFGTGAKLFINGSGAVSVTGGGLSLSNTAGMAVAPGGSLTVQGNFLLGRNGTGNTGFATNNGGTITAAATSVNPNNSSSTSLLAINGGTNDLGNVTVKRSVAGSSGFSALGAEGLIISNGLVRMTSLDVGGDGNSFLTMFVGNGAVTNTGAFTVRQITANRSSRFLQVGGLFVHEGTSGVLLRGHTANNSIVIYSVLGGTNLVSGFVAGDAGDVSGRVNLTNAAKIYVGSAGFTQNGTLAGVNIVLGGGGVFGASADWAGSVPMILAGGAFEAADLGGAAHDIVLSGVVSGTAPLLKTGAGKLTLDAANTYSGNTVINQGTLALGAAGTIASSPQIIVGSGATLDVSAVSGGYALAASRTLGGAGTVAGPVTLASGATVNPGSNFLTGTLTFANSLTQSGGSILHFDLPAAPGNANDRLVIAGDLGVSGANVVEVVGGGSPGTVHTLIQYGGVFNGTLANFALSGATGVLSNNAATKTIALVVASAIRSPTSVVWVGNATANDWDVLNRTNWLNGSVLDFFVTGDTVLFNDAGASHPLVNLVGNVAPAAVTVDAKANYTFGGSGSISGAATTLTKTNTGTLTLSATNSYGGATIFGGGMVEVSLLANAGSPSAIGAAPADPANLQFSGGWLRYLGDSVALDRPMTLNAGGGTLDVASAGSTLTLNGALSGTGTLTKAGPGTLELAAANSHSGGTLINNSVVQVDLATAFGSAGVTNSGSILRINGALTVDNAMDFSGNCTVDAAAAAGNTALRGAWSGSGTVTIVNLESASRTFTIGGGGAGGGHMWDFAGTVSFGTNAGFFRINNDNGNFNFGSSNAVFDVGTGTAALNQRNGGTTTYLGALLGGPGTRLSGRGGSGASGTTTYVIGGRNMDTTFEGEINDGSGTTAITKTGTGKLTLTGSSIHTGDTFVEAGTLQLDGHFTSSTVSVLGGTLGGTGILDSVVSVQAGGVLSPGPALGTLTINSTLVLEGEVQMEVSKGVGQDQIAAAAINYGGTLTLTSVGAALDAGDSFPLFNTATPSGDFASIAGSPGAGLTWRFDPTTGFVTVEGNGAPRLGYAQVGNNLQFNWSGNFKLQVQTNALDIGLSSNWVDYPGGGASGVSVPIGAAAPSVFFRLATP